MTVQSNAISAYIPCFNNSATVLDAVESVRNQTVPIEEVFVVDDGSTDDSAAILESAGIRVIRMERNLGRGAVRARAMEEARNELVLCCDATNTLSSDFVQKALHWFDDPKVAAIFGRIMQRPARNVVERWRGRHLFRISTPLSIKRKAPLLTGGTLVRRSPVLAVGNFNAALSRNEDADLGERLLANSYDVIFDPDLPVISQACNTLGQVLERYSRWNTAIGKRMGVIEYLRILAYSVRVLARRDLKEKDPLAILISLICPHTQLWYSWKQHIDRPASLPALTAFRSRSNLQGDTKAGDL